MLIAACAFLTASACAQASPRPAKEGKWRLIWSDEFNGPNGSGVDPSKWVVEVGGKGWGNQELEYYTTRRENVYIQDGNLVIAGATGELHGHGRREPELHFSQVEDCGQILANLWPLRGAHQNSCRARACGQLFGCWAMTSTKQAGPPVAKSTSWRTSARSRRRFTDRFTGRATAEAMESKRPSRCRQRGGLPTIFMFSRSSGSRMRFASMSTTIFTSLALHLIFRPGWQVGIRSPVFSDTECRGRRRLAREIQTRPQFSLKPCWWIMSACTSDRAE